jgi:hypothetical protein
VGIEEVNVRPRVTILATLRQVTRNGVAPVLCAAWAVTSRLMNARVKRLA